MPDDHATPCMHTSAVRELQLTQRAQGETVAAVSRAQGIALSRLGIDMDGAQVGNGHTVLGRLEAGEERDEAMSKVIGEIRDTILTRDVMERTIKKAAAWVVGAIAFVGGPPAIIAVVKMLWVKP